MLVAVFAAWLCDDYYFSLKPAWNLIQGHGLRHNVAERVQGFSNPLWTLLLAGNFVVQDVHHTSTLAMSMGLTLGAALLFAFRAAPTPTGAILGLVILAASKSFIDYTSSGLENPLAHLLYLGFLTVWFSAANPARRAPLLCLLAALLACTRLDLSLLVAPPLLLLLRATPPRRWWLLAAGSGSLTEAPPASPDGSKSESPSPGIGCCCDVNIQNIVKKNEKPFRYMYDLT